MLTHELWSTENFGLEGDETEIRKLSPSTPTAKEDGVKVMEDGAAGSLTGSSPDVFLHEQTTARAVIITNKVLYFIAYEFCLKGLFREKIGREVISLHD